MPLFLVVAQVILGLAQDTKDSRQRALQLKALKEKQAQDKASTLKEAYLKKQLLKAKGASLKGKPALPASTSAVTDKKD